jgi:amino acid adenylation domain-containing protein
MNTMNVKSLVRRLRENNIHISLRGANLQINSNEGPIPGVLLEELKLNKEEIIGYLRNNGNGVREAEVGSIVALGLQESYALSSFQRRLWILSQFEDSNIAYNMPGNYVFKGDLDLQALEASFGSLIGRHESLRTVFRESEGGEIRQYIQAAESSGFHIRYTDLRGAGDREGRCRELMGEEFVRPFDLSAGPLLRAQVLQVGDQEWILTYTMHHIVSDGWSMGILLRELLLFYRSHEQGAGAPLPALRIQYRDYASWQQGQLRGPVLEGHRRYWLQQLQGELPVLDLPGDRVRPAVKSYRGGMLVRRMDGRLSQGLREQVRGQGATLFMGLLAAVNALLYRYTGQPDILVGSPVAGRDHADLEDQIGLYLNTVVLRTQIHGEESFRELLERVRRSTLEVYEHQVYPFDALVEELPLRRDTSRNPLFDVLVILQNHDISNKKALLSQENLQVERFEAGESPTSKFDLTFSFMDGEEGLEVSTEYNSDIFNKGTIERLVGHLEGLLGAVVRDPSVAVGRLDYLSGSERQELLVRNNATLRDYPRDKSIVGLIGDQVRLWRERIAVWDEDRSYSYGQLEELSDRIAERIVERLGRSDRSPVGVLLGRSADMVVVLVGVLKSGRAYIPLDGSHPAERLNYILSQSGASILIQDEEAPSGLDLTGLLTVRREELMGEEGRAGESVRLPEGGLATAEDTAYILYTSGSTGRPKGIAVGHRSVVNFLTGMQRSPGMRAGEVLFAVTTYSFDISVLELFLPLVSGGTVYVAGRQLLSDPVRVIEKLEAVRPDWLQATPAFYQMLFESGWEGDKGLRVLCGGDLLSEQLSERLVERTGEAWNMYGPTETTIWSMSKRLEAGKSGGVIGKPIQNTSIYILDGGGQLQPVGVPGSIYIGGEGLAKGYYRNAALTEERFMSSPFAAGERIYDTGDVGKWNAEGEVIFMGRKDNQVKIRGYRIELGEIEGALASHPAIGTAVVVARPGQDGERELVAYPVYREGATAVQASDIKTYLGELLPAYMLPAYYLSLERLPLSANGKIDRKALPDPEELSLPAGTTYVAPRNETEVQLVEVWQEILGKKTIGVKDDFFVSGGNSLKLIRLADRIYKAFNSKLALTELFVRVTPEEQAKLIRGSKKTVYYTIDPAPAAQFYALSPSQERIWLMDQMGIAKKAYTIYGAYTFEEELNSALFMQAVGDMIARQESLQTVFVIREGLPRQQVLEGSALDLGKVVTDLSGDAGAAGRIEELKRDLFGHEFELDVWPLCKLTVIKGESSWTLLYCLHHIISDGWSMELFIRDLWAIYQSRLTGAALTLPVLTIQYKDYAYWQNKLLSAGELADQEEYWITQLGGVLPELRLPYDLEPQGETMNDRASCFQMEMEEGLKDKIDRYLKGRRSTLFSLLIACFKVMLHRLTGNTDIITGVPVANREQEEVRDLIGFFGNTLMLRDRVDKKMGFDLLLEQVNATMMKGLENQAYPFERMLETLQVKRDHHQFPMSSVFLNMLNFNEAKNSYWADTFLGQMDGPMYAKLDIECYFLEHTSGISVNCVYKSDLFKEETIGYWIK